MADKNKPNKAAQAQAVKRPQGRSSLDEQLDELLRRRAHYAAVIAAANKTRDEAREVAELRWKIDVGATPKHLDDIDIRLASFIERHRYWLTRRHSKTIVRPEGEVKLVLRAAEMDTPADENSAVELLLMRAGGKKYLITSYKLDRRKLLTAPSELRSALRSLGFWWGRHRTISVKSPSDDKPKQLVRRRYNQRL